MNFYYDLIEKASVCALPEHKHHMENYVGEEERLVEMQEEEGYPSR